MVKNRSELIKIEKQSRLLSLDFMRGFIMFLLTLESAEFYSHLRNVIPQGSLGFTVISQFFHNQWRGLNFWDLIQPSFMFMAGVAMAYSITRQINEGIDWNSRFTKILKRSSWLLFWGLFVRVSGSDWLSLEKMDVTDILLQLAFTTIIAFFLFDSKMKFQILWCIILLLLTDMLYRFWPIAGFNEVFTDQKNFGDYIDWILFKKHTQGYVFINWLPTAVHTIAGVIVGKLFVQKKVSVKYFIVAGLLFLTIGYGLDITNIIPIIKPIATGSFILASLGFCLLIIALFYWWIDIKQHQKGFFFFQVLGVNSIFIYLFFSIVGRNWLNAYTEMIVYPIFNLFGFSHNWILIIASLCIFAIEWSICYFLYQKKIFFKL